MVKLCLGKKRSDWGVIDNKTSVIDFVEQVFPLSEEL